jgi:MYXO-CTERM domain-containing protein
MRLVILVTMLVPAAAWAADAGPTDAGPARGGATNVIDFSGDEADPLGDEITVRDPAPLEHESLLPERYHDKPAAPAETNAPEPESRRGRGCAGCAAGDAGGPPWWGFAAAWLVAALRRRRVWRVLQTLVG